MEKEGLSAKEMDEILNKKSGMLGVSGVSSDDRDIQAAKEAGNTRAAMVLDMRTYEIIKFIGGYVAALGGVDAIVFTAGVGENQQSIRSDVLEGLAYLGIRVDYEANKARGEEVEITTPDSAVRSFVIPTNEELVIARDTRAIVEAMA